MHFTKHSTVAKTEIIQNIKTLWIWFKNKFKFAMLTGTSQNNIVLTAFSVSHKAILFLLYIFIPQAKIQTELFTDRSTFIRGILCPQGSGHTRPPGERRCHSGWAAGRPGRWAHPSSPNLWTAPPFFEGVWQCRRSWLCMRFICARQQAIKTLLKSSENGPRNGLFFPFF